MNLFDVYSNYDIDLVEGKGALLYDNKGKQYLDFYGGHGVISIGHSHPHYIFRLQHQLQCLGFYSNAVKNSLQSKLACLLGKMSGYDNYNLFLCNSGAEANENALKVAAFHTGKKKIVAMKGAFHGRSSGALAVTDNPALSSPFNASHEVEFVDLNDAKALELVMEKGDVAGVIIEGIQGVNGVFAPQTQYLKDARDLCTKYGALLILDEVQSGYGRTGKFFAHQYANVEADMITTAKGMGNGFPVAGVLISPVVEAKKGMLGTTFGGNYLACAACIAVLEIIEEESLMDNASNVGTYIKEQLATIPQIKAVRGQGMMIGMDLEQMSNVRNSLVKDHGIFTGASGKDTLRLLPPLNITTGDADGFIAALKQTLEKVC